MITGYNTDVRHSNVVFHVQTEDKGAHNPQIESLVYVGGQVLAARRSSYRALVDSGSSDDKAVTALMDRQHRTMIAAIRDGRFDAKLAALLGRPAAEAEAVGPPAAGPSAAGPSAAGPTAAGATAAGSNAVESTAADLLPEAPPPPSDSTAVRPASPAAAVATAPPPSAAAGEERTLDQVILEYLTSEAEQEQLVLELADQADVALGRRGFVALRACSSKSGDGVGGAEVMVKMISTVDEPQALASGTTDPTGSLKLVFDVPPLDRGTAALIISAASPIGRAELKQLL